MTSLVFPAYNPGAGINRAWHHARDFIRRRPERWEILFVLDGCTDDTEDRLESMRRTAPDSRIRIVSYPHNRGKGHAVRTGMLAANGDYRIFTDVDLQFWDGVERTAAALYAGADLVVAARTHAESRINIPASCLSYTVRRRIQSAVFNTVTRLLLPIQIGDTQAGLKGMSARMAQTILPRTIINGFGFDCEWLTIAARLGITPHQIPLTLRFDTVESTTKPKTILRILRDLWRIRKAWRKSPIDWQLPEVQESQVVHRRAA